MRDAKIGHVDRHRATYHSKGSVRHMFDAYDLEQDTLTATFFAEKSWKNGLSFLKISRCRYPSRETLHIALDNATYHSKAEVRHMLKHIR
jgi:hypothetical protein